MPCKKAAVQGRNMSRLSFPELTNVVLFGPLSLQEAIMNNYEQGKKARRIVSVIYILIMTVVMTGTYLSQQQKEADKVSQNLPSP